MSEFKLWWKNPGDGEDVIWSLRLDDTGDSVFYFAPFTVSNKHPSCELRGFVERSPMPLPGTLVVSKMTESGVVARADHERAVDAALELIAQEELVKVVLSRSDVWRANGSPESVFAAKCKTHPNALVYLMSHPEAGIWIGATPELLLKGIENRFETVSLAGTRPLDGSYPWTEKEVQEQALVTDFIQKILVRDGACKITVGPLHTRPYGDISHLETRIGFESDRPFDAWVRALHPTPAVAGLPRDKALSFIAEKEEHSRGYYAGFLGWKTPNEVNFYVNLRCMEWFANGARVYAGGGIVAGSDPADEWNETEAKMSSIRLMDMAGAKS